MRRLVLLVGLLAVVLCKDHGKLAPIDYSFGIPEAEEEVAEAKRAVEEQQAVVDGLRESLSAGNFGTCSAHDHECVRNHGLTADPSGSRREKHGEKARIVARLVVPPKAGKITGIRWLPFLDPGVGKRMHRLLVAADNKGALHFFSNKGQHVSSHPTGSSHAIQALAASLKWDGECKIIAGHVNGEVRVFTISPPPRHEFPEKIALEHIERIEKEGKGKKRAKVLPSARSPWQPMILLVSSFFPPKMTMLEWDNSTHNVADFSTGPQPISFVDIVPRGRNSFNVLVGDASGRISQHLRNGSLVSSFDLPVSSQDRDETDVANPRCSVAWGNFAAVCGRRGLTLYNTKDRYVYPTRCMGFPAEDKDPSVVTEKGKGKTKAPLRPTEEVESRFVSLQQDPVHNSFLLAGTNDGRFLGLSVRGEGKVLRCTVCELSLSPLGCSGLFRVPWWHGAFGRDFPLCAAHLLHGDVLHLEYSSPSG